jgi:hypothetical protein
MERRCLCLPAACASASALARLFKIDEMLFGMRLMGDSRARSGDRSGACRPTGTTKTAYAAAASGFKAHLAIPYIGMKIG